MTMREKLIEESSCSRSHHPTNEHTQKTTDSTVPKSTQNNSKNLSRQSKTTMIHPTALIEHGVSIGDGSQVWDNVHIRKNTTIGTETTIGEKSYIAYDVTIGNRVKINAMVYICTAVTIEDMCMISAGTVFTNDLFPRAMNRSLTALETSEPNENTLRTIVKKGVTIGANATIGPGITLGEFCMVGMGSVVTKDVPAYGLVVGNPAKLIGYVCVCGPRLDTNRQPIVCSHCKRGYSFNKKQGLYLLP